MFVDEVKEAYENSTDFLAVLNKEIADVKLKIIATARNKRSGMPYRNDSVFISQNVREYLEREGFFIHEFNEKAFYISWSKARC